MDKAYTVAQARARFAEILDDVETGEDVTITRRGKPVARVVSIETYERSAAPHQGSRGFWAALAAYRERPDFEGVSLDDEEIRAWRDADPGRGDPWPR